MGLFALTGVTFSSWLARIPTVRDALDLSTAELGGILLIGSLGALVTVTFSGMIVQRWGSRTGMLAATFVLAAGYVLMGVGPTVGSVAVLAVGIFLNGVAIALGNVPLNVESSRIERAMGRTVIPQFHAGFSIGAVVGSGLGAAASHAHVSVALQFSVVAAVAVVWRLASLRGVVLDDAVTPRPVRTSVAPDAPRPVGRRRIATALDSWREPRTLLIGVVIMAAALSEGSANDWLSLAVVDGFSQTEAVGGAVLGLFVGAMTVVRLLGTRLIDRFGRVRVLRASGVVSILGLLLFGFAPSLTLAGVGVVAWGFGAALAVPIGIAAASDDPLRAAGRVAVVSSFASVASIAAPPLLGIAAEATGARHALVLIVAAMLASVLLSRTVAHQATAAVLDTAPSAVPAVVEAGLSVPGPDLATLVARRAAASHPAPRPDEHDLPDLPDLHELDELHDEVVDRDLASRAQPAHAC
jgi:MFS family permease